MMSYLSWIPLFPSYPEVEGLFNLPPPQPHKSVIDEIYEIEDRMFISYLNRTTTKFLGIQPQTEEYIKLIKEQPPVFQRWIGCMNNTPW